jgi:hypothetical protein
MVLLQKLPGTSLSFIYVALKPESAVQKYVQNLGASVVGEMSKSILN